MLHSIKFLEVFIILQILLSSPYFQENYSGPNFKVLMPCWFQHFFSTHAHKFAEVAFKQKKPQKTETDGNPLKKGE